MSKHANLRLTAKLLPIITPFMAKNDIRYYLNAINVRPHKDGGAVIAATNGHALGAIHDRDAVCEHEAILRFDARMQQACAGGGSNSERTVVMLGDRLAVMENDVTEICIQAGPPEIEANYPNYHRVIPRTDALLPGLIGTFGAPLLDLADKAASAAAKAMKKSRDRYIGMQFFNVNGDPNACAVLRLADAPDFIGVLMPMRYDTMTPAPHWVAGLPAADDLSAMTKSAAQAEITEVPA